MSLKTPSTEPSIAQQLYGLSAIAGGEFNPAELPANLQGLSLHEGRRAAFTVEIDFTDRQRFEESIAGLRKLADVLSSGTRLS